MSSDAGWVVRCALLTMGSMAFTFDACLTVFARHPLRIVMVRNVSFSVTP